MGDRVYLRHWFRTPHEQQSRSRCTMMMRSVIKQYCWELLLCERVT